MAKRSNQKLKIVYLMKILTDNTDDEHALTMADILAELEKYGISAERKSIYNDIEALRQYGLDIICEQKNKTFYYYIGKRTFELAELKLLVDVVQSAKFLTVKKSDELIKKLEGLASRHEALKLQRQVFVSDRIKTMNETIYYNVDIIHSAIAGNNQIMFQYFQWNVKKEQELRHEGKFYKVSPWALLSDNENYYLIAFDSEEDKLKHFRVDKMLKLDETSDKRVGKEFFENINMGIYAKKMFGMYAGEEQSIRLLCENSLVGTIIDRFGKDIFIIPYDDEHFTVNVDVAFSRQFMHWIMALGDGAKIIGPDNVLDKVHDEIERLSELYG